MRENDTAAGLCECGCGQPAPISPVTYARLGYVQGQPRRFIRGHNQRSLAAWTEDDTSGCWDWQGRLNEHGYGFVGFDGRARSAHHWMYEQVHGRVPKGLVVDHLCRNRACVNPTHLEAVTVAVNARRGLKTKLSPADVAAIRAAPTDVQNVALAQQFGVHDSQISRIRSGRSWYSD